MNPLRANGEPIQQSTPAGRSDSIAKANTPWPDVLEMRPASQMRNVFQTTPEMKDEFVKFLKTIFFQLDETKVLALMEEILNDPSKTDEQIYEDLLKRINETKKSVPILNKLWSLYVLKKGMGQQAAELMKCFNPAKFHDYMEIYDKRYISAFRKQAKLPLDGKTIAVCDRPNDPVSVQNRLEAGSLLSRYPYQQQVALNDADCEDPLLTPEKTHKPIGDEVEDGSLDLIGCVGGLHHIPKERVGDFVDSMHRKLRPGGVILVREHNDTNEQVKSLATVVHSFVNAEGQVGWNVENREVREFHSVEHWKNFMKAHGFTPVSEKALVLKDDPTENAMFAFVKTPKTLEDLRKAISYRNDCTRPKEGTCATWIEWGNVRFAKQYADFVQNNHSYAFDFIGHMRHHWTHFIHFVKESLKNDSVPFTHSLFSDAMLMNLFIVIATTIQCSVNSLASLPSRVVARWKDGEKWREVKNFTALEKFEQECEKQYAEDLDTIPFYAQSYIPKIKVMWQRIWSSEDHWTTKLTSSLSAISNTISFVGKAIISAPIYAIYSQESLKEPETVKLLIKDEGNDLDKIIAHPDFEKSKIEVIHQTEDGYKLVSVPRYRLFTKFFSLLKDTAIEVLEIGSQTKVSVDLKIEKDAANPAFTQAREVYELDGLCESQYKFVTYMVDVAALKGFQDHAGKDNIHYIHE